MGISAAKLCFPRGGGAGLLRGLHLGLRAMANKANGVCDGKFYLGVGIRRSQIGE